MIHRDLRRATWAFLLLCMGFSLPLLRADRVQTDDAPETQPADKQEFLRFVDDGNGGGTLQSAIVTYKNERGVTVHLVAAVHIADKAYYKGLAKTFDGYDALLYEMVKPKNLDVKNLADRPPSGVSMFQHMMKNFLDLDFQLDDIDYTKPNFVHADLDTETFAKMQQARGESILGLMVQMAIKEMARQDQSKAQDIGLLDLMGLMNSPDRSRQLKVVLARQFGDMEEQLDAATGSVLISGRDRAALKALREQIEAGKKNLGIFYGAGHMRDMSERLEDMGYHQTASEWRVCWDLHKPDKQADTDDDGK